MAVSLPLTYPDLVCDLDLDPFGGETTSDLESFVQDIYHLLKELPNSNPDHPNKGLGVEQYLGANEVQLAALPGLVEAQIGEDDRCTGVSCSLTQLPTGTFLLGITINVGGNVYPLEFGFVDGNLTNLTK